MARDSASWLRTARRLAIAQMVIGGLLFVSGLGEVIVLRFASAVAGFGIWCGIWLAFTGGLGIPGTSKERTACANSFVGVYTGFSITSVAMAAVGLSGYMIILDVYKDDVWDDRYKAAFSFATMILIFSIISFFLCIWAAVCGCRLCICECCAHSEQQDPQMVYMTNPGMPEGGYVIGQSPGAVPVAFPVQGGGGAGMVAVQVPTSTVMGQQTQTLSHNPQVVDMPVSGQMDPGGVRGGQPQSLQYGAASSHAAMGAYRSQEEQIPVRHSVKKTFV